MAPNMLVTLAALALAVFLTIHAASIADPNAAKEESNYLQQIPADLAYYFQKTSNLLQFSKCFDELGCFYTTDFFDLYYRPFTLVPRDREDINVTFCLYTRNSPRVTNKCPTFIQTEDWTAVNGSGFQADRKTVVIVHGFIDNGLLPWVMLMKRRFLNLDDFNVIVVDWSDGNKFPYTQAAANSWVVGGELFLLLKYLSVNFSLNLKDVHIVGHSLGSHIAGYTGARFKGKIGRISGLDPAGPFFEHLPAKVRLDPTDAMFVDVIHTDGKILLPRPTGYGSLQPFGHVDFYVNGGFLQPGCESLLKMTVTAVIISVVGSFREARRHMFACSHAKAVQYFVDSLSKANQFLAHECANYDDYRGGQCCSCGQDGGKCARMGYYAYKSCGNGTQARSDVTPRTFYLTTREDPIPSVYHYVIHIQLENTKDQSDEDGTLYIALHGTQSSVEEKQLNDESVTFKAGKQYNFVTQSPCLLGAVHKISFRWVSSSLLRYFASHKLYVKRVQVEPMDIINETWRQGNITTAVVSKGQAISSGSTVNLKVQ